MKVSCAICSWEEDVIADEDFTRRVTESGIFSGSPQDHADFYRAMGLAQTHATSTHPEVKGMIAFNPHPTLYAPAFEGATLEESQGNGLNLEWVEKRAERMGTMGENWDDERILAKVYVPRLVARVRELEAAAERRHEEYVMRKNGEARSVEEHLEEQGEKDAN